MTTRIYLIYLMVIASLSACKKQQPVMEEGKAKVRFVNAYLNSDPQEFYQENNKLTQQALAYGAYSGYVEVNSGRSTFWSNGTIENKATSAIEAVLYGQNAYTLLYYKNEASKPSIVGYINQSNVPAAGRFKVRFVNLSVMFNGKPLVISANNNTILSALNFGDNPSYVELVANAELKVNVKEGIKVTVLDKTKFQEGKSYLVWFDSFDGQDVVYNVVQEN